MCGLQNNALQVHLLPMLILIHQVDAFVLHCIGSMCDRWHYLLLVAFLIAILICSFYCYVIFTGKEKRLSKEVKAEKKT